MKNQRAPFQPLSPDLDARLERLAQEKGVGAMVKPVQAEPVHDAAPPPASAPPKAPKATAHATPRSRMKTVNLELPDYVWTDLKIRAAHSQTSVRHVVMRALRNDGITIAETDMVEDGRRLRGRETAH